MMRALATFGFGFCVLSCAHAEPITREPDAPRAGLELASSDGGYFQEGLATWYGGKLAGHKTANGEIFNPSEMTAAHRRLKFGTWVEVIRADDGRRVRVRITDRGPFGHDDRIIDLSRAAADKLGMLKTGVVHVKLKIVEGP